MSIDAQRLHRLLTEEIGECCPADLDERLDVLETFAADIPDDPSDDFLALKTLGNETRYQIVRLLAAADRELCVCEITPVIDVSESAVSHALSDLWEAGLVSRRKKGTWRYYELTSRAARLLGALDETRGEGG